ncbi:electron transport complex subunit RsxC [bacterium]|nr:electron transport complex subunit RsxC [bacterium]
MFRKNSFSGGTHPHDEKQWSSAKAIEIMPLPETVIIPIQQHIGAPSDLIVEKGQTVKKGQALSSSSKFVSVPVHASISGTIKAIEQRPHPLGANLLSVVIESDGEDSWISDFKEEPDYFELDVQQMKQRIADAGVAGMGGAAFPSHVKLSPPEDKNIDTLILNGVECEPFLTADHRIMLERPDEIIKGMRLIMKILKIDTGYIGIEANKPDAIALLKEKVNKETGIEVVVLEVKYPQGAEKQLIKASTNRDVPAGKLPMEIGCVVQNVGTAVAIYEAVAMQKPLIERVVTVTGTSIHEPKNLLARIGTPFSELIACCGGMKDNTAKIVNGGPMMGMAQLTDAVPVIKGTSGILVLDEKTANMQEENPCIACARCVDVCPMKLLPNHIASYVEYNKFDKANELGIFDCMECGTCSFICPAKRHLVHYIKLGKALINEQKKAV